MSGYKCNDWKNISDTDPGTYPSTSGTHNGTLKLNQPLTVQNLYTYPCTSTGGHPEYAKFYNDTWHIESPQWKGYQGDGENIYFNHSFTLVANETYNYTIRIPARIRRFIMHQHY
ncbi:hypothetical protein C5S36_07560 [Candidatus Methanophagaceae archaeon]|nr:hypothetical protein C5S36_07560 [Methanophagales archaeon]